ncbi:MAG: type II toxin-antitoxin system prevent-host-death family antitoxin [Verrucomicrobiota bacterium]|nr:type II toxin-antitoxin system prevent-host-death family antitoxin [Verrucomicrobiota bacterium]
MKNTWQLQEAKSQLSRVVRKAMNEGQQIITVHGEPVVFVTAIGLSTKAKKKKHKIPDYAKMLKEIYGGKIVSSKVMAEILDYNKGPF